jgi:hypothetical protein
MPSFDQDVHAFWDSRTETLAKIKSRSLGADALTLTALNVLIYAQLEGGIKELTSLTIREVNSLQVPLGRVAPCLLAWRNAPEIDRLRKAITFDNVTHHAPLSTELARTIVIRDLSVSSEFNQMNPRSLVKIYSGFHLDQTDLKKTLGRIETLVSARNEAAHNGVLPPLALSLLEQQTRGYVATVEVILTDVSLQLLTLFSKGLHLR